MVALAAGLLGVGLWCYSRLDIDLVVDGFETVDKKLEYLQILLSKKELIAPEIRSAVAWRCALLLLEKRQTSDADAMVKQALTLNPVNWPALCAGDWRPRQAASIARALRNQAAERGGGSLMIWL